MTPPTQERCPNGQPHPFHYSERDEMDGEIYENFICGKCGILVRSIRIK